MHRFSLLLLLTLLTGLAPRSCLAMRSIGTISTNEAKAMGLEIRATPAGPEAVWLDLEFRIESKLRDYQPSVSHVELEIREGDKVLVGYAALQETHPRPGRVLVRFLANRSFLDKIHIVVVVGEGAMVGGAYDLRVREFVDPAPHS